MATQWLGGLTDNTGLYASQLNTIGAAWESWTPVLKQGTTTFTLTTHYAKYCRFQKTIIAIAGVTVSAGTGQATASVSLDLPFTAASGATQLWGSAWIYDASATTGYGGAVSSGGTLATIGYFVGDWAGGASWGNTPNIQMTTSDQVRVNLCYEAA